MSHPTSDQIRQQFLDFFKSKTHLIVDSAPVVPVGDQTLLFTNAGMNQFKPIFLGEQEGYKHEGKVWKRAADTQRCIRVSGKHNDLEEVGLDTYHHTLFEMLGNWSFGDYFKKEAIGWGWELLVDVWGLDPDRLYATVFGGDEHDNLEPDEEAFDLWTSETSINRDHILKFGKKDNFWEMGETGPCGPCSEVHIDLRPDDERKKRDGRELVNRNDPRVMEIWNLVFIQYNRQNGGILNPLPAKHVDTGMGFERMVAVLQGKTSNYDTDVFKPLLNHIEKLSGIQYGADQKTDVAMRVVADHIRAVSFSIADGASPGNDGRGYVIRRILRRAIRYGWDRLNLKEPFMCKLVGTLADQFAHVFPVLAAQREYVQNVIEAEEHNFLRTLGQGIQLFESMIEGKEVLSGEDAFRLHDTFGFPIDLTRLMARENGIEVDEKGFDRRMEEQRTRARAAGKFAVDMSKGGEWTYINEGHDSKFVGYDHLTADVHIQAVKIDGKRNLMILDQTPFYAESGGQLADHGMISNGDEHLRVLDVQKTQGHIIHYVDHLPENPDGDWRAIADRERRYELRKHHSATHLAHAALRKILGDHVGQKGSLVSPERLRFDFSHYKAVSDQELNEIEQLVNLKIQENIPKTEERDIPIDQARDRGAMMLFGEKYGERVRVITFDPEYSIELCGGTHVEATGEIGYFRFVAETAVASGVRRIEAVTGHAADHYLRHEKNIIGDLYQSLGSSEHLVKDINRLIEEKKSAEKELERLRLQLALAELDQLMKNPIEMGNGIRLVTGEIEHGNSDLLKQIGYEALNKSTEGTITVLASRDNEAGKVYLVGTVTDDLIREKSIKAGNLISRVARQLGGGGGGQPNLATAGGRNPEKLDSVLKQMPELITETVA
ncbi:MAG TPA: alanine--tRNA ligase [Balneolales bacterium]|nr:alanine--tRNA ligase [Balneolales bacterium]